ncbi:hypothetical protein BN59_00870 [Legionella massiliensis]|uniref:Uncharacterized protein n=1 Tax=Legionella massiliensis TaxID=1034943 RepID=A0A078KU81_9GAMM|nr:hypothetical protein [Legionella massiliensis]CDZ76596.1 hypothetical protein BN59_00870 [Legionella massiliensis]CEE12334.1 hypothetical protein BN1094_00870 [Legionella massiliensis]
MSKPAQSKWHEIKKQSEAEINFAPVNNPSRIKRLYLDTQIGSPVDTVEELDAQRNNLGPKDTQTELADQPKEPESSSPRP